MRSIRSFPAIQKRRYLSLLALLPVIVIGLVIVGGHEKPVISPLPDRKPTGTTAGKTKQKEILSFKDKDATKLEDTLKSEIGNSWQNYSVYIRDLASDFEVAINETVIFDAASVNKIAILAALYHEAASDDSILDKTITTQQNDIQDYGTGSMRYDPVGTTYSIKTLARLMMQKSDNTASYVLANQILSIPDIQKLIAQWGLTQTDMAKNKTSNKDMYILMKKIYDGEVTTPALTQEMMSFFKDSDFENRIPGLLPKTVTVLHKIGSAVGGEHDVGIVMTPGAAYYIGVFTKDITDEKNADTLISKISKTAYDFLIGV